MNLIILILKYIHFNSVHFNDNAVSTNVLIANVLSIFKDLPTDHDKCCRKVRKEFIRFATEKKQPKKLLPTLMRPPSKSFTSQFQQSKRTLRPSSLLHSATERSLSRNQLKPPSISSIPTSGRATSAGLSRRLGTADARTSTRSMSAGLPGLTRSFAQTPSGTSATSATSEDLSRNLGRTTSESSRSSSMNPSRLPAKTPVKTPVRTPVRTPVKTPVKTPVRTPFRSPALQARTQIQLPRTLMKSPSKAPSSPAFIQKETLTQCAMNLNQKEMSELAVIAAIELCDYYDFLNKSPKKLTRRQMESKLITVLSTQIKIFQRKNIQDKGSKFICKLNL